MYLSYVSCESKYCTYSTELPKFGMGAELRYPKSGCETGLVGGGGV